MAATGYSSTPLWKKLGIKPDNKILLIQPPDNYLQLLDMDIRSQIVGKNGSPDFIHLFVKDQKDFITEMKTLTKSYHDNPAITIWVSWYKKASGIPTDITEDIIREYALKNDLVDVKVCAVSELWSGLKLVVPLRKRG